MAKALSTINTALVLVAKFSLTSDTSITSGKAYFTKEGTTTHYHLVENPKTADIANYYEVDENGTSGVAQLVCIKDYPDLGGSPESIETTTLCDDMQTFIEGVKSNEQLAFTINYEGHTYAILKGMEGAEHDFALCFGDMDGKDGKFSFSGTLSMSVVGKGVNDVREATLTITPSTPISYTIA